MIHRFETELGAHVFWPRRLDSFQKSAADLHAQLAEHRIDVVFFHGSIVTPVDWLLCAWQAAPWQFDRGFGVPLFCPQVDYQFFEMEPLMESLSFLCRERNIPYGLSPLGATDLARFENAPPLPRAELGIPDDHVIFGTVGNHLPTRMGADFCQTVATVMQACPKTTYLVVGVGHFEAQAAILEAANLPDTGGGPRVRFVGNKPDPSRWFKTFDIYLNEYPGGGGMSVREAMAAGRPIVCMQPGESMCSTASAVCVGAENLVNPPTNEAYGRWMFELVQDANRRLAAGQAMYERYQEHFDPRRFVAGMTQRIWDVISADLGGNGD